MKMSHLASKVKALKLELSEDLLVHLVMISLLAQFNQFKVSYNCLKDSWSLNELISHYVQEEQRLKQDRTESGHLARTSKDKMKSNKRKKDKEAAITAPQNNNIRNRLRMVVSSVELQGTRRSNAPTITLGVLRKVCFLIWFVLRLI